MYTVNTKNHQSSHLDGCDDWWFCLHFCKHFADKSFIRLPSYHYQCYQPKPAFHSCKHYALSLHANIMLSLHASIICGGHASLIAFCNINLASLKDNRLLYLPSLRGLLNEVMKTSFVACLQSVSISLALII